MDPRAADHVIVFHERDPDVLKVARPEDMPKPHNAQLMIEIRAAFILRQPDEWVIVRLEDTGARVGRGQLTMYTQPKVAGVN